MSDIIPIRASSVWEWFDCAYRAEAKYLLGMTRPVSAAALLGTALHKSTATYDRARMEGSCLTPSDAAGVLVDELHHQEQPVDWRGESVVEAERIGLSLHTRYCVEISPQYEFKAVEMETEPMDIEVGGIVLRLTGTLDRSRVRKGTNGVGINDLKSGKRAVNPDGTAATRGHAPQIGVYELLYEHTTGEPVTEPATITGLQTTKEARVGQAQIVGAREQLIGREGKPGLLEMLAGMLKAGVFPPNPRSALCSERYCVRWQSCEFRR